MADVFISYKSERRAAAEHLADILEDHGYSVWFDYALATGASFSEQIARELEDAKCVVVLWCNLSVDSIWVKREASYALDRGKLCPAFIESVELPFPYHHEQTINLRNWDGAPRPGQPANLLKEIERHTGIKPEPDKKVLLRAEKAWRRFGAQPLAQFALGQVIKEQEREPDFGKVPEQPPPTPPNTPSTETLVKELLETPSSRAWAKIKDSDDLHAFDDFLLAFPNAPEAEACKRTRAQLAKRKNAEAVEQARKDALAALPRDGYDVSIFDSFIETHQGTDEAFEAAKLRRNCLLRLSDAAPENEETRKKWEAEAAVQILTGEPIPDGRLPFLQTLRISGFDNELFERLQASGIDLSRTYIDPAAEIIERMLAFANLSYLSNLTNLTKLSCARTQVSDLSPIASLTNLGVLSCERTQVSDLSPLVNLTNLGKLSCGGTLVRDLSPLANLANLTELNCATTQVTDWSPVDHVDEVWGRPDDWVRKPKRG